MTRAGLHTVLEIVAQGATALDFSAHQWGDLVRSARHANLLGTLAVRLEAMRESVPVSVRRHLDGARQLSDRQTASVRWEAHNLHQIFAPLGIPIALLKGAAYVLAETPNHYGRMFGDIDILVPHSALGEVERALMTNGWTYSITDTYDQRYYRTWMHELPPMINVRRGTIVDVHHNILPSTARYAPSGNTVLDHSTPLPDLPSIRIPASEDLIIHSITHLLHEGELHNGLRDLADIDTLLRHYSTSASFWEKLLSRTEEQGLSRPLLYGLHFAKQIMTTPIPDRVFDSLQKYAPPAWTLSLMDSLYSQGFRSAVDPEAPHRWALLAIYGRAHWLRMPPLLLARHLANKAWRQLKRGGNPEPLKK